MIPLSEYDRTRYKRQIEIPGWGIEGQEKIKAARVFVAGAGGLGSPVAIYLAVAGVGQIDLVDADRVELSNLNRQILHSDHRIGQLKVESAVQSLRMLNPTLRIVPHAVYLDEHNAEELIGQPDIVLDCLDNFETRYLLNDYCLRHHIPMVHGAIRGLLGQITFLHPPETPCLRCIVPTPPPKEVFPVLGATPGLVGSLQVLEALKYLAGVGETLKGRLLIVDAEDMSFTPIKVKRAPNCPDCGGRL